MQVGQLVIVRTNSGTQFVGAAAQDALLTATMPMTPPGQLAGDGYVDGALAGGRSVRSRLKQVMIASVENLAWEVSLWGNSDYNSQTNPALAFLWGKATFAAADGKRYGGAGLYYYALSGLDIPYVDLEKVGSIYLGLASRAGAKSTGPTGSVTVQLAFEPTLGW